MSVKNQGKHGKLFTIKCVLINPINFLTSKTQMPHGYANITLLSCAQNNEDALLRPLKVSAVFQKEYTTNKQGHIFPKTREMSEILNIIPLLMKSSNKYINCIKLDD